MGRGVMYADQVVKIECLKVKFECSKVRFEWLKGQRSVQHPEDLRVEFLLKTESGYLRDAGVTWFTLTNP